MQLAIDFQSYTAPYARRSATSKAAAKAVEPRIGTQIAKVLGYIKLCAEAGATDDEIERGTHMGGSTVRPRRGELAMRGLIQKSGTRKTLSGRDADVWVAV